MRSNFQSLLLVILILASLVITKEARIETLVAKQPASFAESIKVSSVGQEESATAAASAPAVAEEISLQTLLKPIPFGFLSKSSSSQSIIFDDQSLSPKQSSNIVLNTKIALVSDFDEENDFISYNINRRWPLASITKLMTAVLAIEEIGQEKEIIASEDALVVEGNLGKLEAGKLYSVDDLIKIMILTSSNHAAVALADFYIFGQAEFVKLMNKKAGELDMSQTVFFDPTGLSPINQSTANDIRKLMKYIIKNHPQVLVYSQEKSSGDFKNINYFAGQPNFLGGKTGYLDEAKQNLVSLFSVNNRRILIVVLGAEDRFKQTQEFLSYASSVVNH